MERQRIHRAKGTDERDKDHWYMGYYFMLADTTYCFQEDYERAAKEGEDPRHHYIIFDQMTDWGMPNKHLQTEIRPETLCMCTDYVINNQYVFEKDIMGLEDIIGSDRNVGIVRFGKYRNPYDSSKTEHYGFYIEWQDNALLRNDIGYWMNNSNIMILGNVVDNPEILERRRK